jgi:hypothetical protein
MNYNYDYRRGPVIEPAQLKAANDMYHATSTQKYMLGAKLELADGRIFRYCEAGAVALSKALMCQQAVVTANWANQVQTTGTAAAIADTSIKVYVATAPSAHDWDNGWLNIRDGTGIGEVYNIKSHDASLLPVIQIADEGGIRTATATTSEITVIKNLYKDVVVHPVTTATGMAVGVPLTTIAINYFGWLQTHGPCPMIVDTSDTLTVGTPVGVPATSAVAGACDVRQSTYAEWGVCTTAIGEADGTAVIYLTLE